MNFFFQRVQILALPRNLLYEDGRPAIDFRNDVVRHDAGAGEGAGLEGGKGALNSAGAVKFA